MTSVRTFWKRFSVSRSYGARPFVFHVELLPSGHIWVDLLKPSHQPVRKKPRLLKSQRNEPLLFKPARLILISEESRASRWTLHDSCSHFIWINDWWLQCSPETAECCRNRLWKMSLTKTSGHKWLFGNDSALQLVALLGQGRIRTLVDQLTDVFLGHLSSHRWDRSIKSGFDGIESINIGETSRRTFKTIWPLLSSHQSIQHCGWERIISSKKYTRRQILFWRFYWKNNLQERVWMKKYKFKSLQYSLRASGQGCVTPRFLRKPSQKGYGNGWLWSWWRRTIQVYKRRSKWHCVRNASE